MNSADEHAEDLTQAVGLLQEDTGEVKGLVESLPYSLRIMSEEGTQDRVREAYWHRTREEIERTGGVEVGCYVDDEMVRGFRELQAGHELEVRIGDLENRTAALIAFDQFERPVGTLLNNYPEVESYNLFVTEFASAMRGSRLRAVVTEVCEEVNDGEHPCHFRVLVEPRSRWWEDWAPDGPDEEREDRMRSNCLRSLSNKELLLSG